MTPRRAPPSGGPPTRRRRRAAAAAPGGVVQLLQARIVRALDARQRYTYVQPRVVAAAEVPGTAGTGWCITSPNCSRNIDPAGGQIPIAWFEPDAGRPGRWRLHAFDHGLQHWACQADGLALDQALDQVLLDPERRYWP